jgi:hypothetical protein
MEAKEAAGMSYRHALRRFVSYRHPALRRFCSSSSES